MQNFDGKHEDITVVSSLVFEKVVGRWSFGIKRKQLAQIDNYFNRSFNINSDIYLNRRKYSWLLSYPIRWNTLPFPVFYAPLLILHWMFFINIHIHVS